MTKSIVDPATIEAYRETEYRVGGEHGFVLWIGETSSPLLDAYRRCGVKCSAFVPACKPLSEALDPQQNAIVWTQADGVPQLVMLR